jgi:hypothetical protein
MMKDYEYIRSREYFRQMAEDAMKSENMERVDYYTGIVRGLDLAFEDGSAKKN